MNHSEARISWNKINVAGWKSTSDDWQLLPGDTIISVPASTYSHELANDSIIVEWSRLGSVTANLELKINGYAGFARIEPRPLARDLPPLWVELERMRCSSQQESERWSGLCPTLHAEFHGRTSSAWAERAA